MSFLKDTFKAFTNRVIHALRMGKKLTGTDINLLKSLFLKIQTKNLVLARALLSSLSDGEKNETDVKKFASLLDSATKNIGENKKPFSEEEKKEIKELFKRHSLSNKAAESFTLGLDEILAMELRAQIDKKEILAKKPEKEKKEKLKI